MRKAYILVTLSFWVVVGLIWVGSMRSPATDQASVPARERDVSATELARHAGADDCWIAIRGSVYDLTAYLPKHPSRPGMIEPWCGKEATQAYETKTRGRRHSAEADRLLTGYRIGTLAPTTSH